MTTSQDCDSEDTTKTSTSQKGGLGFRSFPQPRRLFGGDRGLSK